MQRTVANFLRKLVGSRFGPAALGAKRRRGMMSVRVVPF